jgi:hypothetical protein
LTSKQRNLILEACLRCISSFLADQSRSVASKDKTYFIVLFTGQVLRLFAPFGGRNLENMSDKNQKHEKVQISLNICEKKKNSKSFKRK